MRRAVVISGIGTVSALGVGVGPMWESLRAGRSGLGPITTLDASGFASRQAGEAKGVSGKDHVPKGYRKAVKVMARDTELAVVAAKAAVEDAGLITRAHAETGQTTQTYASGRMGCHIGAGLISAETLELAMAQATAVSAASGEFSLRDWGTVESDGVKPAGGMGNLQPLWMLKYLPNMLACHVTIIHGCEGPSNTITCAEASALLSMGESRRVIERGDAEVCFSGGAESKLSLMGLLRYELAGFLAPCGEHDNAADAVRPFDPSSRGTLVGEGGGILVLEEEAAATARGAKVYARVTGFGAAQSLNNCIPPLRVPDQGALNDGLALAVLAALRDAGLTPSDIDAIVPQANGVPLGDAGELAALREVFGDRLATIDLVPLVPYTGSAAAGHGALQAALGALMLREQALPARIHTGQTVPGINAGPAPSRSAALRHVLVCTGALGGQNAAVVLSRV